MARKLTKLFRKRRGRHAPSVVALLTFLTAVAHCHSGRADVPLLEADVLPILTKNCMGCHGGLKQKGGLDLRTVPAMLAGGESGPAIVPGNANKSELWQRIASDEMPEGDDREKLSPQQKATIKTWIDAGMPTVSARQQNVDPLLPADKQHAPQEVAGAIDKHIGGFLASAKLETAPPADDAEFMRRIYLNLTGRVPNAEQAKRFLDNHDADKRSKLIDELLSKPEFGEQLGRTWRDWVCPPELPSDQNGGKQPHAQVIDLGRWFAKRFNEDASWDKITREILTVKGEIKDNRQVIFFGLVGKDGKTTADGTAQAVASLFMGVQLQCARCHDDPYRDWAQREHWALAAFFGRSQGDFGKIEVGQGPSKKPGEIEIPGSAFKNAGASIQAAFLGGDKSQVKKSGDIREPFADWLTKKDNPYFARAFVNRMWFYLFSRGIVNPIDDMRPLNPPSHPGLMKLLAGEFTSSGYDVKHLIRCICNSQAYQRTSRVKPGTDAGTRSALTTAFGRMPLRLMTADMLRDSFMLAYGANEFDLRAGPKENTVGESAAVGDPYLEFMRKFETNEEDATDFTHGISQMLTFINHPRFLAGSVALDEYLKRSKDAAPEQVIEWLYLSTLSRRPTDEELADTKEYLAEESEAEPDYIGVLWMLVNRSEFILVR